MIIIRNNLLPIGKNYGAINLFGVLFVKRDMFLTPNVLNHERIHTAQMRELLFIPFYILYVLEWMWRLICERGNLYRAYLAISHEKEAYAHARDLTYLSNRPHFAQWRKNQHMHEP